MDIENLSPQFRILIVDDNREIHKDFKKILAFSPVAYSIHSAYQGEEALKRVKESLRANQPYAVAFVEARMPAGWDGIETVSRIWEIDPHLQIALCTAYSDDSCAAWEDLYQRFGENDRLLILKKPFGNIEVRQFTLTLCEKWALAKQVKQQLEGLQKIVEEKTLELRDALSILRATFESTADGILVTNMKNEVVDSNKKFAKLWEISEVILGSGKFQNLLGFMMNQMKYPGAFLKRMQDFYTDRNKESLDLLKLKNGKILECYSQPQTRDHETIGRVWSFRDITQRRSLEEQLAYQATHDVLTGLSNRVLWLKRVEEGIHTAKMRKTHALVLLFDLDRFKLINDSLGHLLGDKLLKIVAERMQQCIRPTDTLARLGGDEFVVFMSSLSSENEVGNIVRRFFNTLSRPFNMDGNILNMTTSIGISLYPKDGETAEILLKNADAAMYRAKEMGRNNFQYYTASMNIHNAERLALGNDLNTALERNEFQIFYQPLLKVKNKKILGVEALLRWLHPKRGLLHPIEFIPIAEETGLIVPIGEWVLLTAAQQIKKWQKEGLADLWVAVNLSPNQFKRGDILKTIDKVLKETQLEPKYLCLEITENIMLEDNVKLRKTLKDLKLRGIQLAIDDFGVGYSNLSYITHFPIDKLKIDKSFIRGVTVDNNDASIVLAILGIARDLSMEVLAEGVETQEQLKFLQENKCDEFQGFLVSEPVDSITCEKMLHQSKES